MAVGGGGALGGYFTLPTPNDALTNGFQLEKKQDLVVSGGSKNINRLHCDGKGGVYPPLNEPHFVCVVGWLG